MKNLEKLLTTCGTDYALYKLGHAICYGLIQDCRQCPVRSWKERNGIVKYYCGENRENFVQLAKWAMKEAE